MEVYEGAELQLRSFLPSALEGDESTHHAAVALHPPRRGTTPATH